MATTSKLHPPGKPYMFGMPKGLTGIVAGWIMARTNAKHNAWAIDRLRVQPYDHILEIGFGPGTGIELIAKQANQGFAAGVDPSQVMLKQAQQRNAPEVKTGRVVLKEGTAASLPFPDRHFDKVLSVNNIMLWSDVNEGLREAHRVLKPGGMVVIALNPRWAASHDDVKDMGLEIVNHVTQTGFTQVAMETKEDIKPFGAVIVTAQVPTD